MSLTTDKEGPLNIPRNVPYEAVSSLRGFSRQILESIDALLDASDGELVCIETFEDILKIKGGDSTAIQVKDRSAPISLTQEDTCVMIDRWAELYATAPSSSFVYLSTQSPGRMAGGETAFQEWIEGNTAEDVRSRIRNGVSKFLAKQRKPPKQPLAAECVHLAKLLANHSDFDAFWDRVSWRVREGDANALRSRIIRKMRKELVAETELESRLSMWFGEIAQTASDENTPADRRWTKARLLAIKTPTDRRVWAWIDLYRAIHNDQVAAIHSMIEEVLARLRGQSSSQWRLAPPAYNRSVRLDGAADAVISSLETGGRTVALRGKPGDGKSQVGSQVATRLGAAHFSLAPNDPPETAWVVALHAVCSGLGMSEIPDDARIEELLSRFRDAFVRSGCRVIVFDNVDRALPFAISELLPSDASFSFVFIGPGAQGVQHDVMLPSTSETEFVEIARLCLPSGVVIDAEVDSLIRRVGNLTDYTALVAASLNLISSETFKSDLSDFVGAIEAEYSNGLEAQVTAAIKKCWAGLNSIERQRATFVAAMDEPQIPLDWLPSPVRQGPPSSWRVLRDAGVAHREQQMMRLHRLIAIGVRDAALDADTSLVANALFTWATTSAYEDELKTEGPRQRSFVRAVKFLHRRGNLPHEPDQRAAVLTTFLDCSRDAHRNDSKLVSVLQQLWGESPLNADLPPAVAAQLVDIIGSGRGDGPLRAWRERAQRVIDGFVKEHPLNVTHDMYSYECADVHRHFAKELRRRNDEQASKHLQDLCKYCDAATSLVDTDEWHVQSAKAKLQYAKELAPSDAIALLDAQIAASTGRLPAYLELELTRQVLVANVPGAGRSAAVQRGLTLCDRCGNLEVRGSFLSSVASHLEITGAYGMYSALHDASVRILQQYEESQFKLPLKRFNAGHAVIKAAGHGLTAEAHLTLCRGLRIYARIMDDLDTFHLGRIAAGFREAGRPEISCRLALKADAISADQFFRFEAAKSLRWQGDHDHAIATLIQMESAREMPNAVRDELAKNYVAVGKIDLVKKLLAENIPAYRGENLEAFATRCQTWIDEIEAPALSATGLRQDEWRCSQRRASIPKLTLDDLDAELTSLGARFNDASIRSRKDPRKA